jgi:hypothetical protein
MAETDAEVVAALAAELGYPSETEAIGVRIRAIGESDLLLVAVDASTRQSDLSRRIGFALLKWVFGWKFSAWSYHRRPVAAGLRAG